MPTQPELESIAREIRAAQEAVRQIEPEIVLHLRSTPPAGAGPAQTLECVDWVAQAFEIVQSHFPGWRFRAADTVADSALHAALLIGPRRGVGDLGEDPVAALERFSLALFCDARELERGRGSNVLGSPLSAVAHLVSVLDRQPAAAPLQAGEVVTTGTITRACSVRPGETWHSEVEGIGLPGLTVGFV